MENEKWLIDANELLKLYDMGEELEEYAGVLSVPIPVIRQNIKDMPTVDAVEVVHGRWVRKAHDGAFGVFHLWHCSVCDTIRARQDPYCGECGAKMDGGADNG